VELPDLPEPTRQVIADHKAAFASLLQRHLGLDGSVVMLVDGAITHAVLHRSTEPIDRARQLAHQLVSAKDHTR